MPSPSSYRSRSFEGSPRRSTTASSSRRRSISGAPGTTTHTTNTTSGLVEVDGRSLIVPNSSFARAVVMGNTSSSAGTPHLPETTASKHPLVTTTTTTQGQRTQQRPASNLTLLLGLQQQLQQQQQQQPPSTGTSPSDSTMRQATNEVLPSSTFHIQQEEADSASGPSFIAAVSAPVSFLRQTPPGGVTSNRVVGTASVVNPPVAIPTSDLAQPARVRRCMSSKELGTLAPPSGSPYATMLHKKEELEISMRNRLMATRESLPVAAAAATRVSSASSAAAVAAAGPIEAHSEESSTSSSRRRETPNETRNRRRAEHTQAVVDDLCNIVADLFEAESKLLNPSSYGVPQQQQQQQQHHSSPHSSSSKNSQREQLVNSIRSFVTALPLRYALSSDKPSEVLLHMRLMAAARADRNKVAVHIHNLSSEQHDNTWSGHARSLMSSRRRGGGNRSLSLVTISCRDAIGLLEYISRLLATEGSRVLDADVMLTRDGIVLDRFVVEMNGRLRLDRLTNLTEAFLRDHADSDSDNAVPNEKPGSSPAEPSGPLYYQQAQREKSPRQRDLRQEIETAVPLTDVLASSSNNPGMESQIPSIPQLRKLHSMPLQSSSLPNIPTVRLSMREEAQPELDPEPVELAATQKSGRQQRTRELVDRAGSSNLDDFGLGTDEPVLDYVTIPSSDGVGGAGAVENRVIPLIPFDELMLIEALGTGRVSTIYRAAWRRDHLRDIAPSDGVQMVALKVAMVNPTTGDTGHVDELRREADIAARLRHPNICDLVGVAADAECFCLAYDFCEGGSLLSLLSDSTRYYEYLPIALDVANGMAYLHSRNLIHRDLKPSNVLLTRDHRAVVADFGMSIANTGQEHTGETGTYRYMAPEVIRHEPYSSNADVYSFGILLYQLITREIPFATLTPIQAAYAVAEGRRPEIPESTPRRLQEIITSCWDQDSHKRPSFTYIAMALADYAKMAFSPATVGALTLSIANEMLATVEGNSTVNVDFTTPVQGSVDVGYDGSQGSNVGLEIE